MTVPTLVPVRNCYNAFGSLPDRSKKPHEVTSEEKQEIYRWHCYQTIEKIMQWAEEVQTSEAGRGLHGMYIMTNGPVMEWVHVASSRDLMLNQEQKYVQQVVFSLGTSPVLILIGLLVV
ncbi:uncharacterized protein LAESUDRAFT_758779 [Laetiporus sulphureus 93-53]|uniref:Uncharacterized protein n=1 Tax=Laetiporus sulphureus 93-53 TaxID=1314785 RepID=A0A165EFP1_9APHY|nr:uncharacterized protein LAESUDRAFT_758779 [Laetiporus sulphureus 93-53]KZT06961.1 hypothetical protein LAESUDRAFT_758779 [Laetiporus sulphureus 93-53]